MGSRWKFRLPMASAILTALHPDDFIVYDYRVCEQLQQLRVGEFQSLGDKTSLATVWDAHRDFIQAVKTVQARHGIASLRDADHWLAGKPMAEQLEAGIKRRVRHR